MSQRRLPAHERVYTTGQVARLCRVATWTVAKWVDSGRLVGYRIPGSRERRVLRKELVRFLRDNGLPLGELEAEDARNLLLVGVGGALAARLREVLPAESGYRHELAACGFEAGVLAETFYADAVVIDLAMGRGECLQIAQNLRRYPRYERIPVIALANEDDPDPGGLTRYGFSQVFQKPFDVALLAEALAGRPGGRGC
jgi:excisionase family DNA binding protein